MIREDTSDGAEGRKQEEEEEEPSSSRRHSYNIPYPQISITDTQGQVTTMENAEDGTEKTFPATPAPPEITRSQSESNTCPTTSPTQTQSSQQYAKFTLFSQYPGLDLTSIPGTGEEDPAMEVDPESPVHSPLPLHRTYPNMVGLTSTAYSTPACYHPYLMGDTTSLLLHHHRQNQRQRGYRQSASASSSPLSTPLFARAPTPMGSAGSSPDFDSHTDAVIADSYHGDQSPRSSGEESMLQLDALNLHNGLAHMPTSCLSLQVSSFAC